MKSTFKKIFQWLVKKLEDAERLNVLKTVSRLTGCIVFAILHLFPSISDSAFLSFLVTVLLMDSIFMFSGLKESKYKAPYFFEMNKITPQSLDSYSRTMTLLKLVLIVPLVWTGHLAGAFLLYFPVPWVVAYFTNYKPYIPHANTSDDKPWYYGKGGFGMAGNYTGKPGSVGGQSG